MNNMGVGRDYIISPLEETHPLLQEELNIPRERTLYKIVIKEEDRISPSHLARAIRDQVVLLDIRVGSKITLVVEDSQGLEENVCISILQRRFQETVDIIVRRSKLTHTVPYLVNLRPLSKREKDDGMVNYSYSCGPCSGDCSSCG